MSDEHFRYAEQAMMMDAPRILRSTMTKLSGTLAQVAALEAAYNGIGQEQSAEAMSGLVKPLAEARHAIEQALEAMAEGNAPTLAGVRPETAQTATEVAFDLEDGLMAWIEEHRKLPGAVVIRADLFAIIREVWPERDALELPNGVVAMREGDQAEPFVFVDA